MHVSDLLMNCLVLFEAEGRSWLFFLCTLYVVHCMLYVVGTDDFVIGLTRDHSESFDRFCTRGVS